MDSFFKRQHPNLSDLAELGVLGHFPLFEILPTWTNEINSPPNKSLLKKEKIKAQELLKRLELLGSLERQREELKNFKDEERKILMRAFIKIVEGKIIDKRPTIQ